MNTSPLQSAIDELGSQAKLADVVGVKQSTVSYRLTTGKPVPAEWCIPIERATDGKVPAYSLRPDIFPTPAEAA